MSITPRVAIAFFLCLALTQWGQTPEGLTPSAFSLRGLNLREDPRRRQDLKAGLEAGLDGTDQEWTVAKLVNHFQELKAPLLLETLPEEERRGVLAWYEKVFADPQMRQAGWTPTLAAEVLGRFRQAGEMVGQRLPGFSWFSALVLYPESHEDWDARIVLAEKGRKGALLLNPLNPRLRAENAVRFAEYLFFTRFGHFLLLLDPEYAAKAVLPSLEEVLASLLDLKVAARHRDWLSWMGPVWLFLAQRLTQPEGLRDHPWLRIPSIPPLSSADRHFLLWWQGVLGFHATHLVGDRAILLFGQTRPELMAELFRGIDENLDWIESRYEAEGRLVLALNRYEQAKQKETRRVRPFSRRLAPRRSLNQKKEGFFNQWTFAINDILRLAKHQALLNFMKDERRSPRLERVKRLVSRVLNDMASVRLRATKRLPELASAAGGFRQDWQGVYQETLARLNTLAELLQFQAAAGLEAGVVRFEHRALRRISAERVSLEALGLGERLAPLTPFQAAVLKAFVHRDREYLPPLHMDRDFTVELTAQEVEQVLGRVQKLWYRVPSSRRTDDFDVVKATIIRNLSRTFESTLFSASLHRHAQEYVMMFKALVGNALNQLASAAGLEAGQGLTIGDVLKRLKELEPRLHSIDIYERLPDGRERLLDQLIEGEIPGEVSLVDRFDVFVATHRRWGSPQEGGVSFDFIPLRSSPQDPHQLVKITGYSTADTAKLKLYLERHQYPGGPIQMISDWFDRPADGARILFLGDPHHVEADEIPQSKVLLIPYGEFLERLVSYLIQEKGLRKLFLEAPPRMMSEESQEMFERPPFYWHPMLRAAIGHPQVSVIGFDPRKRRGNLPLAGGKLEQRFHRRILRRINLKDPQEKALVILGDDHLAKTEGLDRVGRLFSQTPGLKTTTVTVKVGWREDLRALGVGLNPSEEALSRTGLPLAAVNRTDDPSLADLVHIETYPVVPTVDNDPGWWTYVLTRQPSRTPIRLKDFDQMVYFGNPDAIREYLRSFAAGLESVTPLGWTRRFSDLRALGIRFFEGLTDVTDGGEMAPEEMLPFLNSGDRVLQVPVAPLSEAATPNPKVLLVQPGLEAPPAWVEVVDEVRELPLDLAEARQVLEEAGAGSLALLNAAAGLEAEQDAWKELLAGFEVLGLWILPGAELDSESGDLPTIIAILKASGGSLRARDLRAVVVKGQRQLLIFL